MAIAPAGLTDYGREYDLSFEPAEGKGNDWGHWKIMTLAMTDSRRAKNWVLEVHNLTLDNLGGSDIFSFRHLTSLSLYLHLIYKFNLPLCREEVSAWRT